MVVWYQDRDGEVSYSRNHIVFIVRWVSLLTRSTVVST